MNIPVRGDKLKIPAGIVVRSMNPNPAKKRRVTTRPFTITVFDTSKFYARYHDEYLRANDKDHDVVEVTWVGGGGYWNYAFLEDIDGTY